MPDYLKRLLILIVAGAVLGAVVVEILVFVFDLPTVVAFLLGMIGGGFGYMPWLTVPRIRRWVGLA